MFDESNKPTAIAPGINFGMRKITYGKAINYYPAIVVKKSNGNKVVYSIQTIHAGRNINAAVEKAIKQYEIVVPMKNKEKELLRQRAKKVIADKKAQNEIVKKIPKEFQKQFFTNLKEGF